MTNKQHPITPSSELLQDWGGRFYDQQLTFDELVTEVYKAGADQELEACIEWISGWYGSGCGELINGLRIARRPKPLSEADQALAELEKVDMLWETSEFGADTLSALDTIRRALKRLKELEAVNG